jgi:hypothetical protein
MTMKMKRLFTLVLSLMMILSLSAPASAIDGENVYTKEDTRKDGWSFSVSK